MEDFILIPSSFLLIAAILLHGAGMYFLFCVRETATNQKILLINMSLTEFCCAITTLISNFMIYFEADETRFQMLTVLTLNGLSWFSYYIYILSPLLLVVDRLIGVTVPLLYKNYFSKRKAILCVILTWLLGVIFSIPLAFIDLQSRMTYAPFPAAATEILVIVVFLGAYIRIGYEIWNRPASIRSNDGNFKVLKMASLIIITFILLVALPDATVIMLIASEMNPRLAVQYGRTVYHTVSVLNFVIDPIIYLFGYLPMRKIMKDKLCIVLSN